MAKTPEVTTPKAAAAPVETPAPAPAAPPPSAETALAKPAPTAITPALGAQQALAARLPEKYRDDVLLLKRPTAEELFNTVSSLPATWQDKMLTLVAKTRPKKQGVHTTNTGFAPTSLKLYHGVGADPARPRQTLPGQFYTGDSRVIGEKFNAVPLGFYQGRILWPPQGTGGTESKAPICVSADRHTGSKYGECAACALATRQYTAGGCMNEVTFWLLDEDLISIYELKFSKSSVTAGESLVKVVTKAENIWDRWFTFESQERVEGNKRWYVQKASPLVDPKNPERNNTPKELHRLFSDLSKVLDSDVYYPLLADVHDRVKNSTEVGGAPVAAEAFDEKSFMAAETSENPDYSKDA